jgi:hypothetical protein
MLYTRSSPSERSHGQPLAAKDVARYRAVSEAAARYHKFSRKTEWNWEHSWEWCGAKGLFESLTRPKGRAGPCERKAGRVEKGSVAKLIGPAAFDRAIKGAS